MACIGTLNSQKKYANMSKLCLLKGRDLGRRGLAYITQTVISYSILVLGNWSCCCRRIIHLYVPDTSLNWSYSICVGLIHSSANTSWLAWRLIYFNCCSIWADLLLSRMRWIVSRSETSMCPCIHVSMCPSIVHVSIYPRVPRNIDWCPENKYGKAHGILDTLPRVKLYSPLYNI